MSGRSRVGLEMVLRGALHPIGWVLLTVLGFCSIQFAWIGIRECPGKSPVQRYWPVLFLGSAVIYSLVLWRTGLEPRRVLLRVGVLLFVFFMAASLFMQLFGAVDRGRQAFTVAAMKSMATAIDRELGKSRAPLHVKSVRELNAATGSDFSSCDG